MNSAIVILLDNEVHAVYIVPSENASIENMRRLRDQKNQHFRLMNRIRIQRVLLSEADANVSSIEDVSNRLSELLETEK